jgi:hypothetical protein
VPDETGTGTGEDWSFPTVEPYDGALAPEADLPGETRPTDPPSAALLPVPRRTSLGTGPVSPLRALAGAAVAVAGVLLGIGALLWATDAPTGTPALQEPQAQTARVSTSRSPAPSPTSAVVVTPVPLRSTTPAAAAQVQPVPKLPLTVLNNSTRNKLADRAAARYRASGWPVKLTGNFRGRIVATTVYYAPGQRASAQLLQRMFPAIERVLPRFTGLPGSGLTVVLTRAYPG